MMTKTKRVLLLSIVAIIQMAFLVYFIDAGKREFTEIPADQVQWVRTACLLYFPILYNGEKKSFKENWKEILFPVLFILLFGLLINYFTSSVGDFIWPIAENDPATLSVYNYYSKILKIISSISYLFFLALFVILFQKEK